MGGVDAVVSGAAVLPMTAPLPSEGHATTAVGSPSSADTAGKETKQNGMSSDSKIFVSVACGAGVRGSIIANSWHQLSNTGCGFSDELPDSNCLGGQQCNQCKLHARACLFGQSRGLDSVSPV